MKPIWEGMHYKNCYAEYGTSGLHAGPIQSLVQVKWENKASDHFTGVKTTTKGSDDTYEIWRISFRLKTYEEESISSIKILRSCMPSISAIVDISDNNDRTTQRVKVCWQGTSSWSILNRNDLVCITWIWVTAYNYMRNVHFNLILSKREMQIFCFSYTLLQDPIRGTYHEKINH